MAIQQVGESTCTLGEIRNRADLVIFWGVDPARSHPRHFERYSVEPVGEQIPHGRADRTVVVVDNHPTESSRQADWFIPVEPEHDFETLWTLRCLVKGAVPQPVDDSGVPLDVLQQLADRMKTCRCGVVFFGLGLAQSHLGHRNVEALLRLVADLNAHTRFHARRMRIPGDVTGADTVLCWQTGYPFAVNLSRGYPRYNPENTRPTHCSSVVKWMPVCSSAARGSRRCPPLRSLACGKSPSSLWIIRRSRRPACRPFA